MNKILLTNIQRFSLHDGPGIRTTVFLKGCSLRCPWCSNPENLEPTPQPYVKDGRRGVYGEYYEPETLIKECLRDKAFYQGRIDDPAFWSINSAAELDELPGGITFSGGEALLQIGSLIPVITALHKENIHIAVETCLFVQAYNLELALECIDLFYADVKILNPYYCKTVEHGDINLFLENLNRLMTWKDKRGRKKPIVVRIPVIGSYTDNKENRAAVKLLLRKYQESILKIELIKEHNLADSKYRSLNLEMTYNGVSDELMEQYKNELEELGTLTEICKV